jgi:hypothetical protein
MKIKAYRIINVPMVLYGCETWSPVFREKRRLRVFENRVLRRMCLRLTRLTGDWRKLHNVEVNDGCTLHQVLFG